MKKTLIALAAVAVAGTAMAQSTVTMSGRLGFSYLNIDRNVVPVGTTGERQGISATDGHITFNSTEDLGMGLRATARMELRLRGRDDAVAARDATVALSGGFGAVTLGAVELSNGIMGLAAAGAPVIGQDTTLAGLAIETVSLSTTNADILQYTTPELMTGLRVNLTLVDSFGRAAGHGIHGGMGNNEPTHDATVVGLAYSAGPAAFNADYTAFGRNAIAGVVPDDRFRISGSYNFGPVRIGAGWERLSTTALTDNDDTDLMVGISAPIGANMVVGATYAQRDTTGTAADSSGFELGAQYNFSRRTNLQAAYISRELDVRNPNPAISSKETGLRVRLMHTF